MCGRHILYLLTCVGIVVAAMSSVMIGDNGLKVVYEHNDGGYWVGQYDRDGKPYGCWEMYTSGQVLVQRLCFEDGLPVSHKIWENGELTLEMAEDENYRYVQVFPPVDH